jgi:hypothetical protein
MEMESEGGGGEEEAQDPYKGLFEGIHESLGLQQHQKKSNTMNSEWWRGLKC